MNKKTTQTIALSAQLIELGGTAPAEIKLLPAGKFKAKDGRPQGLSGWLMNEAAATTLLNASLNQYDSYLIDYDHQTLHSKTNGQHAPAAGWFSELEWRPGDGLYALDVEWTLPARAAIEAKEYRYISPVLRFDPATGQVTELLMAALVNYPALDGLNDLAAAAALLFTTPQEPAMDLDDLLERLRYLLNLPLTTTAADIAGELDKLKAMIAQPDGTTDGLSALLSANQDEIAALSVQVGTVDPAKFVPIEAVTALQTELALLSAAAHSDKIGKLIAPALADGRLLPGQKEWAEALGKSDLDALSGYLDTAQPIAALAGMQTGGKAPDVDEAAATFKTVPGYAVEPEQAALNAKILAYQAANKTDYMTAALAVGA